MLDEGRLGVEKLRAQIGEREGGRGRNHLAYFPGLRARAVLWPGVAGIYNSKQSRMGTYLGHTWFSLHTHAISFMYSINKQFVDALLCSVFGIQREHPFS